MPGLPRFDKMNVNEITAWVTNNGITGLIARPKKEVIEAGWFESWGPDIYVLSNTPDLAVKAKDGNGNQGVVEANSAVIAGRLTSGATSVATLVEQCHTILDDVHNAAAHTINTTVVP